MTELMTESHGSSSATENAGGEPSLTVDQAIANLSGQDLGLRFYAAWWLGKFRVREPAAIAGLIQALQDEDDRTEAGGYPLRRNAARALGKLGDRSAVPALIECLSCSDAYVREAAAQALEALGDGQAIPALIDRLTIVPLPEAGRDLTDTSEPYDAILEALGTLGAQAAIPQVLPFLNHTQPRIQYSAARALYQLTGEASYAERLVAALQGPVLQLRRTVLADLGVIGYLPSAEPIAKTLAENSLKLIALKGLLENQLQLAQVPNFSDGLPTGAVQVMALMDELL